MDSILLLLLLLRVGTLAVMHHWVDGSDGSRFSTGHFALTHDQ